MLFAMTTVLTTLCAEEAVELPSLPSQGMPEAGQSYIQPYEITDRRFCALTPDPFLCEECLDHDMQFVRLLRFDADGRPERHYGCRPFSTPYVP